MDTPGIWSLISRLYPCSQSGDGRNTSEMQVQGQCAGPLLIIVNYLYTKCIYSILMSVLCVCIHVLVHVFTFHLKMILCIVTLLVNSVNSKVDILAPL